MSTSPFQSFISVLKLENKSSNTIRAYEKCLRKFEDYIRKGRLPRDGETLVKFLAHITNDEKLQPATRSLYITVLKRYYDYLEIKRPKIKTPFVSLGLPKHISKEEFLKLYEVTNDDPQFRAMLSLDYSTAMRKSELITRKMKDLDLDGKKILVSGGKTGPKSDRWLPLNQTAVNDLMSYFSWRMSHGLPPLQPEDYIFHRMSDTSIPVSLTTTAVALYHYCDKAGIERISWHKVRHTRATHLRQDKVSIFDIKDMLGHSSVKTTERYARSDTESLREAVDGKGALK